MLTGDGLITGHAVSHNRSAADRALVDHGDADLLLPGHGAPWRGPIADAVAQARASS